MRRHKYPATLDVTVKGILPTSGHANHQVLFKNRPMHALEGDLRLDYTAVERPTSGQHLMEDQSANEFFAKDLHNTEEDSFNNLLGRDRKLPGQVNPLDTILTLFSLKLRILSVVQNTKLCECSTASEQRQGQPRRQVQSEWAAACRGHCARHNRQPAARHCYRAGARISKTRPAPRPWRCHIFARLVRSGCRRRPLLFAVGLVGSHGHRLETESRMC